MVMLNLAIIDISKRGLELKKDILRMVEVEGQAVRLLGILLLHFPKANSFLIADMKNIGDYLDNCPCHALHLTVRQFVKILR